jgi:myo-inositol-1(or 4)-monophosphatase
VEDQGAADAQLLELATAVAEEAGRLVLDALERERIAVTTKSTTTDMVSEVDRASERLLLDRILQARPDDSVVGEEGTGRAGTSGVQWVLDPLDGTTNYLYGFPVFAVSVAAQVDGVPAVGVVHDPLHRETFAATRGGGARRNGHTIQASAVTDLAHALVGTGFSYRSDQRAWQATAVAHLLPRVRDIRRAGSAALDLCWVACGRLDATYERGLQPWDHAAGALIAAEAGAFAHVEPDSPWARVVSCAPAITERFLALVEEAEAAAGVRPAGS